MTHKRKTRRHTRKVNKRGSGPSKSKSRSMRLSDLGSSASKGAMRLSELGSSKGKMVLSDLESSASKGAMK